MSRRRSFNLVFSPFLFVFCSSRISFLWPEFVSLFTQILLPLFFLLFRWCVRAHRVKWNHVDSVYGPLLFFLCFCARWFVRMSSNALLSLFCLVFMYHFCLMFSHCIWSSSSLPSSSFSFSLRCFRFFLFDGVNVATHSIRVAVVSDVLARLENNSLTQWRFIVVSRTQHKNNEEMTKKRFSMSFLCFSFFFYLYFRYFICLALSLTSLRFHRMQLFLMLRNDTSAEFWQKCLTISLDSLTIWWDNQEWNGCRLIARSK